MALVAASGQPNQGSRFAQQGSFDWVALGQTQFSASIAILGRLSSAGVEPLTVAVGQAICSKIPLGVHGEKFLNKAMAGLQAFSSFGDAIWFGVGVRHILRVLVQNAHGASLVALCAGLREGHDQSTSALVMYELVKRFGSPCDMTPAFSQWEALIKVCSSVFCRSTLGLRVDQLLRLGGYTRYPQNLPAAHPQDLAEVILAVGDVASGSLQEIDIRGGPACSWVAAFADQILGLRVTVRSNDGAVLSMNYDSSVAIAQISLQFCDDLPSDRLACVGRVFYVRHGDDFIQQCFQGLANLSSSTLDRVPFVGGRLKWDAMFHETFGKDADDLFSPSTRSSVEIIAEPLGLDDHFAQLFVSGAAFYTFFTADACRYENPTDFVLAAMDSVPELRPLRPKLLETASHYIKTSTTQMSVFKKYSRARRQLTSRCRCPVHAKEYLRKSGVQAIYCLPRIATTTLALSYYLGSLLLHDHLMPKRIGFLRIYSDIREIDEDGEADSYCSSDFHPLFWLQSRLTPWFSDLSYRFSRYVTLFSGEPSPVLLGTSISAMSDGTIYCYIDTVQSLSDRFEKASVIHVGAGSIQSGNRLHYTVFDGKRYDDKSRFGYPARKVEVVERGHSPFAEDFTTSDLHIEAVVEESVRLAFSYRVSSTAGEIHISPGYFVKEILARAVDFKTKELPRSFTADNSSDLVDQYLSVVHGEGVISEKSDTRIIVRPHRGNTLGRCVALMTSSPPVAMLNSKSDFSTFTKLWALEDATNAEGKSLHYTIIS